MLRTIRKISSSIFAKIFLVIVAIPFIFWGMGPVFQGGKKNIIVEIGKEKVSIQEFIDFVRLQITNEDILDQKLIEKLLANFIGEKLITLESDNLNIKLSDNSLRAIMIKVGLYEPEEISKIELPTGRRFCIIFKNLGYVSISDSINNNSLSLDIFSSNSGMFLVV